MRQSEPFLASTSSAALVFTLTWEDIQLSPRDVLPFSKTVSSRNTKAFGVNTIGLERKGFSPDQVSSIKKAFRLLLQSKLNTTQAVEAIRREVESPEARVVIDFIEKSGRGIIK